MRVEQEGRGEDQGAHIGTNPEMGEQPGEDNAASERGAATASGGSEPARWNLRVRAPPEKPSPERGEKREGSRGRERDGVRKVG